MGAFQKFVEWGTDAKYVPLGRKCDICGSKLGFFQTGFWSINAKQLTDGVLCKHCDEKLRLLLEDCPHWVRKDMRNKAPYRGYTPAKRFRMDTHSAKQLIETSETFGAEYLSAFGTGYTSIFRANQTCVICPDSLQVGIKRAKLLKNKAVVYGFVQLGQFRQGDQVLIDQGAYALEATVLEAYVYDCEENTLDLMLRSHMGKQRLEQWQEGWLVLDTEETLSNHAAVIG